MTVVGVLCWYDEPADALALAVSGFARVCDQIVAVDGAYALYPQAQPRSLPEQSDAILAACEAAGIGCLLHRPAQVFLGNEVGKRNLSVRLAEVFEPTWLVVFDADFRVTRCVAESVRHDLATTDRHVGAYAIRDEHGTGRFRGVYRWTPDLRYVDAHFDVRGTYAGEAFRLRENALAFDVALDVVHRRSSRSEERLSAADEYALTRTVYGVEALGRTPELVA